MGMVEGINAENYPAQGNLIGKLQAICYEYDTSKTFIALCVRDDKDSPYRTIFKVDNVAEGTRFVLSTECMYTTPREWHKYEND